MNARRVQWVERAIDVAAAAALAGAAACAAVRLDFSVGVDAAIVTAAFLAGWRSLSAIAVESPTFIMDGFELPPMPQVTEMDELVLTEADRLEPAHADVGDKELVLDDVLAELGDNSRVVRLFDPSAMPTPAELKARIDRHIDESDPPSAFPDASRALHDALAELRRSLR